MKRAGAWLRLSVLGSASFALVATAAAPPLADAKAYVISIYRQIPGHFDYGRVHYSSTLGVLIRRDSAFSRRSGDVGAIEAVPFCGCQDTDPDYRIIATSVKPLGAKGAAVSVLLHNGTDQRFTIDLVREQEEWRVADVHGPDVPSLLALLQRGVPREEASLTASANRRR